MKKTYRPLHFSLLALLAAALLTVACSRTKHVTGYNPTRKTYHASPNINERTASFVVLHHTACNFDTAYMLLATKKGKVSSHYLIDRDGTILQLVDEKKRAWHAGASKWFSLQDLNTASIGIEIVNTGFEPFPDRQIDSLLVLLNNLKERYKFPARSFIGHMDIAPGRKVDPNAYFPWKRLAQEGYGIWYDEEKALQMSQDSTVVSTYRDPQVNLMLLGYGISKPTASIEAFKLHFTQSDRTGVLSLYDQSVLQLLADQLIEDAKQLK